MAGNKHQLFLLHGMGKQAEGWSAGMETAIRAAFKNIPAVGTLRFDDFFEFVPLRYDHHFDDLRKQWAKMGKELTKFLGPLATEGELDATSKFIVKLAKAANAFEKDDFIRTHLLDVFLYRFASQSRHTVRTKVADQILKRLEKLDKASLIRWSVIAHSLGTGVAHDTLHEMFSAPGKMQTKLGQLVFPSALVMLANVSRVLESDIDVYTSLVAPGAPADPHRFAVRQYINAFHEFDPIPAPSPFEPVSTWPAPAVRDDALYTHRRISDIEDLDAHAAEHHLRNPRIYGPMFNALFEGRIMSADDIDTAYARYRATLPVNQISQLIDQLKAFNPKAGDTALAILKKWRDFLDAVKK
jgi:hypothetical protein